MGTINYKTMEYITLSINPDIFEENQEEFYAINPEVEESERINYTLYDDLYEEIRESAQDILDNYTFTYFKLDIEPGYYEGLQISLETDFYFDTKEEKIRLYKRIIRLEKVFY